MGDRGGRRREFHPGWIGRAERASQREQPDAVAPGGATEQATSGVRDDVLGALVFEDADGRVDASTGLELPEPLPVAGVERRQTTIVSADKQQIARRRDRATVADVLPSLAPDETIGLHVERGQNRCRRDLHSGEDATHVALPIVRNFKIPVATAEKLDAVVRTHVEQLGPGIVRAGRPVGAAEGGRLRDDPFRPEWREDLPLIDEAVALRGDVDRLGHEGVTDRIGLGRSGRLPRLLRHGTLLDPDQRLAGLAVEDVHPPALARLPQALALDSVDLEIEQDDRIGRIVVPEVVMDLLKMPPVSTGGRFDRHDGDGKQIVASPHGAVEVGARIARREIQQAELRVDGWRLPHGRAAMPPHVAVLRPRVVSDFAGSRDRVERPRRRAVACIVGCHAATNAVLGPAESRDHQPVVVEGRARDAEALLPPLRLDVPDRLAGRLVQRNESPVEPAHVDAPVAQCDAATGPATADRRNIRVQVRLVHPENRSRLDADREHVVGACDHVDHTLVHDRLGLARVSRTDPRAREACAPDRTELGDRLPIDLGEGREALIEEVAAIRQPAGRRERGEALAREGRSRADAFIASGPSVR